MGYKQYFVYMMSNRWRNVLYTGVTNSLEKRVWQHKTKAIPGFTKKYNCDRLVSREKQVKAWSRKKKDVLIALLNPDCNDLAEDWYSDLAKGIPRRLRGSE